MKGFVPTPPQLVDAMVEKLFYKRPPIKADRLLDPGCGTGAFIQGVVRWCDRNASELPQIVGIEPDPFLLEEADKALGHIPQVDLRLADFLQNSHEHYDYVIGNPPYVSIIGLSVDERT